MHAVLTGDVIGSARADSPEIWAMPLRTTLGTIGEEPMRWQLYRGDSFQATVAAEKGLDLVFRILAAMRAVNCDVRISIGLGDETHKGNQVTESTGTAYINSGRAFETLEERKRKLVLRSDNQEFNRRWDILLYLLETLTNNWTRISAETMALRLAETHVSQNALAAALGITQPSVSSRLRVAHADPITETLNYYRHDVQSLS